MFCARHRQKKRVGRSKWICHALSASAGVIFLVKSFRLDGWIPYTTASHMVGTCRRGRMTLDALLIRAFSDSICSRVPQPSVLRLRVLTFPAVRTVNQSFIITLD